MRTSRSLRLPTFGLLFWVLMSGATELRGDEIIGIGRGVVHERRQRRRGTDSSGYAGRFEQGTQGRRSNCRGRRKPTIRRCKSEE